MKRSILILVCVLFGFAGSASGAAGDWNVYLDASAIVDISMMGDSLWCASNGGILLFDLTDSTFTQFLDGLQLRSGDISSVEIDINGSIWAGFLSKGMVRIDDPGITSEVTHFSENSPFNQILSDSVTCLERAGSDVYYGTTRGIRKFFDNIHSFEPNLSDSLAGRKINDLFFDGSINSLWIGFDHGVALFDRGSFEYRSWNVGQVHSICEHQGGMYIATDTGVLLFNGTDWEDTGGGFHVPPVLGISSGGGEIFAATAERVYRYNGTYWASVEATGLKTIFNDDYRIKSNHIRTIVVDDNGSPWIGGRRPEGGIRGSYLSTYDGVAWKNKRMKQLSQNSVIRVDTAPGGSVWVSTGYGINYLSPTGGWSVYTKMRIDTGDDEALSYFASNLALLFDDQNILWCNSLNYDLDMIDVGDPFDPDDDIWRHFSTDDLTSITSDRFVSARLDPVGNRWFLSDDDLQQEGKWGIDIVDRTASNWLSVNPGTTPAMAGGAIFDCAFDAAGVYLAMRGYGVQYWHTGGFSWDDLTNTSDDYWITVLDQDDLPATQLTSIEISNDGSRWIGTSSGLVHDRGIDGIDSFSVKTSYSGEGLVGLLVYDLEFDAYGNLWVATNQGLNRINPDGEIDRVYTTASLWEDRFQFVYPETVISPLPSPVCLWLACDGAEDILWIATDAGLARLDVTPEVEVDIQLVRAVLYPNPIHTARGDDRLRISRISGTVDIRVYTLAGELVHEVDGVSDGGEAWDLLSINGYKAVSGIYIVRIIGTNSSEVRKVAIIR
ncbi:MAG: T9SS type A sorting domain-containing protein [Candidatus Krumholzibacteria bacterium]|nr:T9SS type A sorting domain-containing protein [Candidatus Krumholzibacteria bacterium]